MSAEPAITLSHDSTVVCRPLAHCVLTSDPQMLSPKPASNRYCRHLLIGVTRPAEPTWNSSMSLGSRLLRFRISLMMGTISSEWVMALKTPLLPARPIGVRTPSTITASLIEDNSLPFEKVVFIVPARRSA